jgi:hypothetical protein
MVKTMEPLTEIIRIVEFLNAKVDDALSEAGDRYGDVFVLRFSGGYMCIDFYGETIWDSNDDERPWDGNRQMPLREWLTKAAVNVVDRHNLAACALGEGSL